VRRRRLPARRGTTALVAASPTSDLRALEQVISIQFPVRAATTFLRRSLANKVSLKLVEAQRGEAVGCVREVEIIHVHTGARTTLRGERVLANGEPASFYVPDNLVQIRARAEGAAARSGTLSAQDEIVLHVPMRGYMQYLPGLFQGEGPIQARPVPTPRDLSMQHWQPPELIDQHAPDGDHDEDPLRRFLFVFQHVMSTVNERIERLVDLTDPLSCEASFLPWLASWVGFDLDGSLPVHQQRELVRRAIRLMRTRGTRLGIEEMVRVLTAAPARVEERMPPQAAVLGRAALIGGTTVAERYQRGEPAGAYLMSPSARPPTSFFTLRLEPRGRFASRFGERASQVLRRIVNVVTAERPTHVHFVITFDSGDS